MEVDEGAVGRRLQESTGPQIRDKTTLAPSVSRIWLPYHLTSRTKTENLCLQATIDWIIVSDRFYEFSVSFLDVVITIVRIAMDSDKIMAINLDYLDLARVYLNQEYEFP